MKILFVLDSFPVVSEAFIASQINALIKLGNEVKIFTLSKSNSFLKYPDIHEFNLLSKTTYGIPKKKWQRITKALYTTIKLIIFHPEVALKYFKDHEFVGWYEKLNQLFLLDYCIGKGFDVIHAHFGTVGTEIVFLKRYLTVKIVTTFHGYDLKKAWLAKGKGFHKLFHNADFIISICEFNKIKLLEAGCPLDKIFSLYNGIDTEKFNFRGRNCSLKKNVILTVARLVEVKNIMLALQVLYEIKNRKKYTFVYKLAGDGPLKETIIQKVNEYGLNNEVTMLGSIPQDQIKSLLKETDIFLLTSKEEAFPTVLLEALASGVPAVATRTGGVEEIVQNGVNGFTAELNDVEHLVSSVIKLLDDENLRLQFGKNGRKIVEEKFDILKINKKLMEAYSK